MRNHSTNHLDPRAPLVLDTRDLPRSPGSMRELRRVVPAPEDLGLELIGVPLGADLTLDLRMQSVTEGVYVSGTVDRAAGRGVRTVPAPDRRHARSSTSRSCTRTSTAPPIETTEEDEVGRVQDDLIDLEPVVRDAVVLALPVNPVCRRTARDCARSVGYPWDDLPAGHSHEQVDPRWAALSKLDLPSKLADPSKPTTTEE